MRILIPDALVAQFVADVQDTKTVSDETLMQIASAVEAGAPNPLPSSTPINWAQIITVLLPLLLQLFAAIAPYLGPKEPEPKARVE